MADAMGFDQACRVADEVSPLPQVAHAALQVLRNHCLHMDALMRVMGGAEDSQNDAQELEQILSKCRTAAAGKWGVLSTGEKLATALVFQRGDWLDELGYTMLEAVGRVGTQWMKLLPAAVKAMEAEQVVMPSVAPAMPADPSKAVEVVDYHAEIVTTGYAPGYRDAELTLQLTPTEWATAGVAHRACIRMVPAVGLEVVDFIREVHQSAWRGGLPIDVKDGETRPKWIDGHGT